MSLTDDLAASIDLVEATDPQACFERAAWTALLADPKNLTRHGRPAHFTASALPVSTEGSRVCLVLHGRINLWVQPGGHLEGDDTTVAGAAGREMAEETGLFGRIDPEPLMLSRHPAPCGVDWHLDLQMLVTVEETAPVVSDESSDVAWFDIDRLPADLAPGVDSLVEAAVRRLRRNGG